MRDDLEPTLFCAWCNREMGWGGDTVAFTLCEDCVPIVKANFEARMKAAAPRRRPRRAPVGHPTPDAGPTPEA
jgi:hypothetical protein